MTKRTSTFKQIRVAIEDAAQCTAPEFLVEKILILVGDFEEDLDLFDARDDELRKVLQIYSDCVEKNWGGEWPIALLNDPKEWLASELRRILAGEPCTQEEEDSICGRCLEGEFEGPCFAPDTGCSVREERMKEWEKSNILLALETMNHRLDTQAETIAILVEDLESRVKGEPS